MILVENTYGKIVFIWKSIVNQMKVQMILKLNYWFKEPLELLLIEAWLKAN